MSTCSNIYETCVKLTTEQDCVTNDRGQKHAVAFKESRWTPSNEGFRYVAHHHRMLQENTGRITEEWLGLEEFRVGLENHYDFYLWRK